MLFSRERIIAKQSLKLANGASIYFKFYFSYKDKAETIRYDFCHIKRFDKRSNANISAEIFPFLPF